MLVLSQITYFFMYFYHICKQTDWATAQQVGIYEAFSLEDEGFIHFSTEAQVLNTAQLFYKGQQDLVLLYIEAEKLIPEVVFENTTGGEELFPHLYGALNLDAVEKALPFVPNAEGYFEMP